MVAPKDDDRVVRLWRALHGVQNPSNLTVDETDACQIGSHQRTQLMILFKPACSRFGKVPVDVPRAGRSIIAITFDDRWHGQRFIGIEIEPLLRCVTGNMRKEETDGEKKRFVLGHLVNLIDRP